MTTRHLEHAATPLRKSVMAEMEREFAEDFAATAASTFRASSNISVTNSLYHYYTLMSGRSVVQKSAAVKYVDTTVKAGLRDMDSLLAKRSMDFFCLNDGSAPEIDLELRTRKITEFLESYYPIPAPGKPRQNKAQPISAGPLLLRSISVLSHAPAAPEWADRDCHATSFLRSHCGEHLDPAAAAPRRRRTRRGRSAQGATRG